MRASSDDFFLNDTNTNLSQLGCSAVSYFKSSPIYFNMFSAPVTYDCEGNRVAYAPNIGIDLYSGRIITFEKLTRQKFCDSLFLIMVHKDDISTLGCCSFLFQTPFFQTFSKKEKLRVLYISLKTVPLKLVLTDEKENRYPIFENNSTVVFVKSNFIHVGSYVTTVTAYEPVSRELVEDYSIVSEITTPHSEKKVFKIDKKSGR
jgi:hypothetical protein